MPGQHVKVGDIFEVPMQSGKKGYVQYIGNDMTQLNSNVIRVFKRRESIDTVPDIEAIVKDEIEFYAHVTGMEFGVKDKSWEKIGYSSDVGDLKKPLFRDSRDYGNPLVKVSNEWYVWRINETSVYVGKLKGEYTKADVGIVVWPKDIIARMETGKYLFFYPDYK